MYPCSKGKPSSLVSEKNPHLAFPSSFVFQWTIQSSRSWFFSFCSCPLPFLNIFYSQWRLSFIPHLDVILSLPYLLFSHMIIIWISFLLRHSTMWRVDHLTILQGPCRSKQSRRSPVLGDSLQCHVNVKLSTTESVSSWKDQK